MSFRPGIGTPVPFASDREHQMSDRFRIDTLQAVHNVSGSLVWTARGPARLDLLEAIENTVEWCASQQRMVETFIDLFRLLQADLEKSPADVPLDPDDDAAESLLQAEGSTREWHTELCRRRESAIFDPELGGIHESSVTVEYEKLCSGLETLHALCRDSRWYIMNHDARLDESSGMTYSSAETLIADLNAE